MYLPKQEVTLFDAITDYCSTVVGKSWDTLDETELQTVATPVRDALVNGDIRVLCRSASGHSRDVEPEWFIGQHMWEEVWSPTSVTLDLESGIWSGHLVVKRNDFNRAVSSLIERQPADPTQNGYVPPFLAFALDIVRRFDISLEYKFNRDSMQHAILELAEAEAPHLKISTEKARYIATFIGNPDHERGGATKSKSAGRPDNPSAPFEGINYPRPK